MRISVEQRLRRPRWLTVAVPFGSVVFAFLVAAVVLVATGHDPVSTYRQLFDAAFLEKQSIDQTLIVATPIRSLRSIARLADFESRCGASTDHTQAWVSRTITVHRPRSPPRH